MPSFGLAGPTLMGASPDFLSTYLVLPASSLCSTVDWPHLTCLPQQALIESGSCPTIPGRQPWLGPASPKSKSNTSLATPSRQLRLVLAPLESKSCSRQVRSQLNPPGWSQQLHQDLPRQAAHPQQLQPALSGNSPGASPSYQRACSSCSQSLESADLGARVAQQCAQRGHSWSQC